MVRWHAWGICPTCIAKEREGINADYYRGKPAAVDDFVMPYATGQTEAVRKQRPS